MNIIAWLRKPANLLKIAGLILWIAALVGPWSFTKDGVPPPEWCSSPHILTDNGNCVDTLSGGTILSFFGIAFASLFAGLLGGKVQFDSWGRQLLVLFLILVLAFPMASSALHVIKGINQRFQLVYRITWFTAIALAVVYAIEGLNELKPSQLWGIWAYILLGTASLVESFLQRKQKTT